MTVTDQPAAAPVGSSRRVLAVRQARRLPVLPDRGRSAWTWTQRSSFRPPLDAAQYPSKACAERHSSHATCVIAVAGTAAAPRTCRHRKDRHRNGLRDCWLGATRRSTNPSWNPSTCVASNPIAGGI